MTAYTISAYVALLMASGFGSTYWMGMKLVDADKTLTARQRDTAKVFTIGILGVLMLLQVGFGGF